jgi:glutamine---fructose-6-phosphate transaminase (isomerizing)
MCGVVGFIGEKEREDLGQIASILLRALEYRGYDSTGAAIQGEDPHSIVLRKGVGAPSFLVKDLGIEDLQGKILCGQVRWATFGAVDKENSQPHVVNCKTSMYGAHNGNVTNTEQLSQWLTREGHKIVSDNDGEMVVHTIEHFFSLELDKLSHPLSNKDRREAMKRGIVRAQQEMEGSFAAIVVDPVSQTLWAIKNGSSLYAGIGKDEHGLFNVASSDLTSILKFTRVLIPLSEGEVFEFTDNSYRVFASKRIIKKTKGQKDEIIEAGEIIPKHPVRSKLLAKDTELKPEFTYFMEQEIHDQVETAQVVIEKFMGGSDFTLQTTDLINANRNQFIELKPILEQFRNATADKTMKSIFEGFITSPNYSSISSLLTELLDKDFLPTGNASLSTLFSSVDAALLADMLRWCKTKEEQMVLKVIDSFLELEEVEDLSKTSKKFAEKVVEARQAGNHIYLAACGTSYHAAMTASIFFNEISWIELIPILPGEFRGRYSHTVRDNDIVIAITQSGETKDLIDILDDIEKTGKSVTRIAIVNNINSTIAQEKSDLVIPLRCGPEIAVPATKSFINQITVFYTLALEVATTQLEKDLSTPEVKAARKREIELRYEKLKEIPRLIKETIASCNDDVQDAAQQIFTAPSIQILATRINSIAKEGSLKIREVVLNHTEGFEGAEFKHGPNTILGFNTVFGIDHYNNMQNSYTETLQKALALAIQKGISMDRFGKIMQAVNDQTFGAEFNFSLNKNEQELLSEIIPDKHVFQTTEIPYPLIYITGPDERDIRLTISQINTHKIRGSATIIIAEENNRLRTTAEKIPMGAEKYWSRYISLPRTNDTILTIFTSTVALQMLALEMSIKKMSLFNRLKIKNHGVHPDVPKNVSKSITVD